MPRQRLHRLRPSSAPRDFALAYGPPTVAIPPQVLCHNHCKFIQLSPGSTHLPGNEVHLLSRLPPLRSATMTASVRHSTALLPAHAPIQGPQPRLAAPARAGLQKAAPEPAKRLPRHAAASPRACPSLALGSTRSGFTG